MLVVNFKLNSLYNKSKNNGVTLFSGHNNPNVTIITDIISTNATEDNYSVKVATISEVVATTSNNFHDIDTTESVQSTTNPQNSEVTKQDSDNKYITSTQELEVETIRTATEMGVTFTEQAIDRVMTVTTFEKPNNISSTSSNNLETDSTTNGYTVTPVNNFDTTTLTQDDTSTTLRATTEEVTNVSVTVPDNISIAVSY